MAVSKTTKPSLLRRIIEIIKLESSRISRIILGATAIAAAVYVLVAIIGHEMLDLHEGLLIEGAAILLFISVAVEHIAQITQQEKSLVSRSILTNGKPKTRKKTLWTP